MIKRVCTRHWWGASKVGKRMVIKCVYCSRRHPRIKKQGSQWMLNGTTRG